MARLNDSHQPDFRMSRLAASNSWFTPLTPRIKMTACADEVREDGEECGLRRESFESESECE